MPLFDAAGERLRGPDKKEAAEMALAKEKLTWSAGETAGNGEWLVARVCSDDLQYCEAGLAKCEISTGHRMLGGYWNQGVGCSIEVLAELLGDTPKVAFDHYGREWGQHHREPLWKAIGVG